MSRNKTLCMQLLVSNSLKYYPVPHSFALIILFSIFVISVSFSVNCLLTAYIIIKHNKCFFDYLSWLTYWAEWSSPTIRAGTGELLTTVWYLLTDTFILTWISCTPSYICEMITECLTQNNSLEISIS